MALTPFDRDLALHQARIAPITSKPFGSLFVVSGATLVDGDSITLLDGRNIKKFEMDSDGSVSPGARAVSFEETDDQAEIKQAWIDSINAAFDAGEIDIAAAAAPDNEVRLQNQVDGPDGNLPIIENIADVNFTVEGMAGGSLGPELANIPSAVEGEYVFVLGYQLPGLAHRFAVGDFTQVEQTEDFGTTKIVRFVAIVRPPVVVASGVAWRFSLRIDGVEYAGRTIEPGRGRRLVDMAANVSKLVGAHSLGFRLELVNA